MRIHTKFLIFSIGFVMSFGLVTAIVVQTVIKELFLAERQKGAIATATYMAERSVHPMLTENLVDLQILVNDLKDSREDIEYVFLLDSQRKPLVHTFGEGFPVDLKGVNDVDSLQSHSIQSLAILGRTTLDIAVPILRGKAGVVHVGISEEPINRGVSRVMALLGWVIAGVLVLGGGAAVVFARVITKPICELTEVMERVAGGNQEQRVCVATNDEIGALGATFNRMIAEIQRSNQIQTVVNEILHVSLLNVSLADQLELIIRHMVATPWLADETKGCVFLVEDDPDVLVMKAHQGLSTTVQTTCARVPFGQWFCGRAAQTGEIQFGDCTDNRHEDRCGGIAPSDHYCVPIQSGDTMLGVITLQVRAGHRRNVRDEEILYAMADVTAGIIQRKRMEEELERRQEALRTVYESAITSRGSLSDRSDQVVTHLSQLLKVSHVTVERLEGDRIKVISMMADGQIIHDLEMSVTCGPCETVRDKKSICEFRGRLREMFPEDTFFHEYDAHSYLGIPIKNSVGDVIGILHALDREEREFTQDEIHLFEIFGRYISHEIERNIIEAELRQAQKMEVIGQLAGGMVHDFNNLLTAIHGYADLALLTMSEENPLRHDLMEIGRCSVRAATLTRQLLAFSRQHPMTTEIVSVNKTVESMSKIFHRVIAEDISLQADLEPELWNVSADPGQVEQVLMNLAINARDAMPGGGSLLIKTENVYIDEMFCNIHGNARPGRFVCLTFKDTGEGMDAATQARIFEPFYTTKETGKGTGLGLSVVGAIVKRHDGWITVSSERGIGSTFEVYLPAGSGELDDREGEVEPRAFLGGSERILLVEDDECLRELVRRSLEPQGYHVLVASSRDEALSVFRGEGGMIDLLFADAVLPDGSGVELARGLKSEGSGLRVLFTSGYAGDERVWQAIQDSDHQFLRKPYGVSELLRAVRDVLDAE